MLLLVVLLSCLLFAKKKKKKIINVEEEEGERKNSFAAYVCANDFYFAPCLRTQGTSEIRFGCFYYCY